MSGWGRGAPVPRVCRNPRCGKSLEGKRSHATACNQACRRDALRAERRAKRAYEHPRCVVCFGPMDWTPRPFGQANIALRAVTCSRKCAYTRANWLREAA
jgi:hypothetical protein